MPFAQVAGGGGACLNAVQEPGGAACKLPCASPTRGSIMTAPIAGGVDCDLHPAVPHLTSLLPYLNDYWRDQVTTRGMTDLISQSYPTNSPISSRPDWRPG